MKQAKNRSFPPLLCLLFFLFFIDVSLKAGGYPDDDDEQERRISAVLKLKSASSLPQNIENPDEEAQGEKKIVIPTRSLEILMTPSVTPDLSIIKIPDDCEGDNPHIRLVGASPSVETPKELVLRARRPATLADIIEQFRTLLEFLNSPYVDSQEVIPYVAKKLGLLNQGACNFIVRKIFDSQVPFSFFHDFIQRVSTIKNEEGEGPHPRQLRFSLFGLLFIWEDPSSQSLITPPPPAPSHLNVTKGEEDDALIKTRLLSANHAVKASLLRKPVDSRVPLFPSIFRILLPMVNPAGNEEGEAISPRQLKISIFGFPLTWEGSSSQSLIPAFPSHMAAVEEEEKDDVISSMKRHLFSVTYTVTEFIEQRHMQVAVLLAFLWVLLEKLHF